METWQLAALAVGSPVGIKAIEIAVSALWKARETRRDKAEAELERLGAERFDRLERQLAEGLHRLESSVGQTQESQRRTEGEVRDIRASVQQAIATVAAVDSRVSGVSNDHGPRIKACELWIERANAIRDYENQHRAARSARKKPA